MNSIFNKSRQDMNLGSISRIFWLPVEEVTSFYISEGINDITAAVLTVDGWNTVDFIKETAKLVEEPAQGPNGPYKKQKLSFRVAKHYNARIPDFDEMEEREFFVVIADNNNKGKIIGEINLNGEKKGMRFFDESTTGEKYFDRNEYNCYFYNEAPLRAQRAVYDSGLVVEPPIDPGGPGEPILPPVG